MVPITPIEGQTLLLNVHRIAGIEETPETVVTLTGGQRMVVVDIASDLVASIKRVHATARATGAVCRSRRAGDLVNLATATADEPAAATEAAGTVSNVNPLLTGLIDLDRALAAVARVRWGQGGAADARFVDRALAAATTSLRRVSGSIDVQRSGAVAASLAGILDFCADQLVAREHGHGRVPPALLVAMLKRVRRAWAQLAVESTNPATP
jgi:flagellar protein FlbD